MYTLLDCLIRLWKCVRHCALMAKVSEWESQGLRMFLVTATLVSLTPQSNFQDMDETMSHTWHMLKVHPSFFLRSIDFFRKTHEQPPWISSATYSSSFPPSSDPVSIAYQIVYQLLRSAARGILTQLLVISSSPNRGDMRMLSVSWMMRRRWWWEDLVCRHDLNHVAVVSGGSVMISGAHRWCIWWCICGRECPWWRAMVSGRPWRTKSEDRGWTQCHDFSPSDAGCEKQGVNVEECKFLQGRPMRDQYLEQWLCCRRDRTKDGGSFGSSRFEKVKPIVLPRGLNFYAMN